jgi:hypothetical protein
MHHRRSFRIRDYNDLDSEEEIADGYGIKVPLMMADAAESRTPLADAYSGRNKPGPVSDALESMQRDSRTTVSDAVSDDLLARRGVTLEEAIEMRDAAFAGLEKRSQNAWRRRSGDAEPDGDDDNNNERDPNDLEAAMDARERARLERDQRGDNAWRRTNPNAATATERQAERWRGGR